MKATKLYHGISAIFTSVTLVVLFTTDILLFADKAKFFVIISMFGALEFFKYFFISIYFPDILKALGTSTSAHILSAQRSNTDKKLKYILKVIVLIILMTALYHIAIVLLGAGVFDKFEETFLLSLLLSILTFLPVCLYFGPASGVATVFNVHSAHIHSFEVSLKRSVYITLFGAWVGAFVIPLDWDRPWQKWPIPCAFGAISGYCISHIIKLPSLQSNKHSV